MSQITVISYNEYRSTDIYSDIVSKLVDLGTNFQEINLEKNNKKETIYKEGNHVISIGGDGTALKGMQYAWHQESVLLPIGYGEIVYLVNHDKRTYGNLIKQLVNGTYEPTERNVLQFSNKNKSIPAFNDIAITKSGSQRLLDIDVSAYNQKINLKSDGIVISTASGSTAYNYSAGGPIVQPSTNAIILTPVAPFTKFPRSIVFDQDTSIDISINTSSNFDIQIDGVLIDDFDSKDLNISNYERKVEIIGISNKPKLNQFLTQILR